MYVQNLHTILWVGGIYLPVEEVIRLCRALTIWKLPLLGKGLAISAGLPGGERGLWGERGLIGEVGELGSESRILPLILSSLNISKVN